MHRLNGEAQELNEVFEDSETETGEKVNGAVERR